MIEVQGNVILNDLRKTADVYLFADTKEEVISASTSDIVGFPAGYEIAFGSSVLTADGKYGKMKSDGTWSWI